jgi:hypothetical protein
MPEKDAEFGYVTLCRRVSRGHFQHLATAHIANAVVQHHHRLGAKQAAGIEFVIKNNRHQSVTWLQRAKNKDGVLL